MVGEPYEIHGEGRIRIKQDELPEESSVVSFRSTQYAEPLIFVRLPERQPFMELLFRGIKAVTELFDGMKSGKVFAQDKEDEEQTVGGIGDDDIRKDSMGMFTAVAKYTHDAEIFFLLPAGSEVDDGSAIITMDVAVSDTPTDGTGFQFRLKLLHVGVKKRF